MTGKEMENLTNKPILKRCENPSVVLHEFVKQNFKEEMKVDIVYLSNFYYYSKIKVRITLPNGIFREEEGKNKKTAKRKEENGYSEIDHYHKAAQERAEIKTIIKSLQ